jgi:hypothetical protein
MDVTGGLDGALKVMTTLRGRRYQVRDMRVDIGDTASASTVRCTVVATESECQTLMAQLRRCPAVVSAENNQFPDIL